MPTIKNGDLRVSGLIAELMSWILIVIASLPMVVVAQSVAPTFFTTPYMMDIRTSYVSFVNREAIELTLWGPNLNGGFGSWHDGNGQDATYGGASFRPFGKDTDRDLVFDVNYVHDNGISQWEAKGQYIGRNGLGFGLGYVEAHNNIRNLYFTNFIYRKKHGHWNVYLSPQWQKNPDKNDFGGYFALSTDLVFVSAGTDGEQRRGLIGVVVKKREEALLHPVAEILYVDKSLGDRDGVEFLFINGTLGFDGGFMSAQSRLGRALGPSSSIFGNSLSFLSQSWNRTADVWELGQFANVRVIKAEFPNGQKFESFETVLFPLQLVRSSSWAEGFFLGFQNRNIEFDSDTLQSGKAVMIGYKRQFGQALLAIQLLRNFELSSNELVFTFKYYFSRN